MRELREILAAYERLGRSGGSAVLASVVHAEGSTYRRPGARLLILPSDEMVGLVSGGCLEGDLLERARAVRASGQPQRVHYDSRGRDDVLWGLGLGCAGVLDIWMERVDAENPGPLVWLSSWLRDRRGGVIATALSGPQRGARRALARGGSPEGALHGADPALRSALAERRGGRAPWAEGDLVIEHVCPPLRLLIFGGGPDARPVARLGAELGWEVVVTDGRQAYAQPEHFPGARVLKVSAERAVATAEPDEDSYALVMTHHYLHDRVLLADLLRSPARYIGVLGPRQRSMDLLQELESAALLPGEEIASRLFAPAGLDLGAEEPEAIALSLVAEIQAVAAGRSGGWLRDRKGPIHDPVP